MKRILLAVGMLTLLASCFSTGRDFSSDITWVEKNITKQIDVSRKLGRPFSIGSSGGIPTWTYAYYTYALFGSTKYKELKLYWDPNRQVHHFSFSSSFPEDIKSTILGKNTEPPAPPKKQMPRY